MKRILMTMSLAIAMAMTFTHVYANDSQKAAPAESSTESAAPAPVLDLQPDHSLPMPAAVPVVMDFYADWCAPCKMYSPVFDKVAADYAPGVKFVRVNVDDFAELAHIYNVHVLPTTVVVGADGAITALSGVVPEAQLRSVVQGALK